MDTEIAMPLKIISAFSYYSGLTDTTAISLKDSPSLISACGTFTGAMKVMLNLLQMNKWFHVSFLLDTNSTLSLYTAMEAALRNEALSWTLKPFFKQVYRFNGRDKSSFRSLLETAGKTSRGK